MPQVKFLRDFRGVNTGEQFYLAGEVGTFSEAQTAGLLAEGAAVVVAVALPTPPASAPVATPTAAGDAPVSIIYGPEDDEAPKPAKKRASKKAAAKKAVNGPAE